MRIRQIEHRGRDRKVKKLEERIARVEEKQKAGWRFFVQYLVSPLLLVLIGYFLNQRVETAKQEIQAVEVDLKRVTAAQSMLAELFSGTPERGFIADRLMSNLVDSELADEISDIVAAYYSHQSDNTQDSTGIELASRIESAALSIGGPAAEKYTTIRSQGRFHVVVASIPITDLDGAISKAQNLEALGYQAEVHESNTGHYAVTIGRRDFEGAEELLERAKQAGHAPSDSYVIPGLGFVDQVYP